MNSSRAILGICLVAASAILELFAQAPVESLEYQLKARAIKALVFFTDFPLGTRGAGPWVVGVFGKSPIADQLTGLFLPGALIKGRSVQVLFPKTREEVDKVDLLFVSRSEKARMAELFKQVKGKPILTVVDLSEAKDLEPIVNLAIEQEKVKPEINLKAAREAGLTFNSFLLTNSKIVAR